MRALALILLLAGCAASDMSQAIPALCAGRADILARVERQFGETTAAFGLTVDGTLMEILATADGGTWTMIESRPDGLACLIAAGVEWQRLQAKGAGI
jgi:hypothetical protein